MIINKEYYFDDKDYIKKTRANKKQIVLINTSCTLEEHITKIGTRYNGKYDRIPCFFISRDGNVYQHFSVKSYNKLMSEYNIEKNVITIAVENVGWLYKDTLTGDMVDWKGSKYIDGIIEIPWRGKKYWATYPEIQYTKLAELVDYLCKEYGVVKEFIGTNIVVDKPNYFKGIVNRSNYSKNYYDLSPAVDFKKLTKLINK